MAKKKDAQTQKLTSQFFDTYLGEATKKTFGIPDDAIEGNNDIGSEDAYKLISAANGGVNRILQVMRETIKEKTVSAQSSNFRNTFNNLMNNNAEFRKFMLKGTRLSEEDIKDKKDYLAASDPVSNKMRNFLAYALNNSDLTNESSINDEAVTKFLATNFNTNVLPTTPLSLDQSKGK